MPPLHGYLKAGAGLGKSTRPYKCSKCGKKYHELENLHKHKDRNHK